MILRFNLLETRFVHANHVVLPGEEEIWNLCIGHYIYYLY